MCRYMSREMSWNTLFTPFCTCVVGHKCNSANKFPSAWKMVDWNMKWHLYPQRSADINAKSLFDLLKSFSCAAQVVLR